MKSVLLLSILLVLGCTMALGQNQQTIAKIRSLRVNELNIPYGPPADAISAEVIVLLQGNANQAFGFTLRKDEQEIAHVAMLDILRDAFAQDLAVKLTYQMPNGGTKGKIVVVELNK